MQRIHATESAQGKTAALPTLLPLLHHCQQGKIMYPLDEVLLLALLAVLAGAESSVEDGKAGSPIEQESGFSATRVDNVTRRREHPDEAMPGPLGSIPG